MGNPLSEETKDLLTLDTKIVAHQSAAEMIASHYEKGKERFIEFLESLTPGHENKFYDPIKKNKVDFYRQQPGINIIRP